MDALNIALASATPAMPSPSLLQEARARARYHDDWEQDFRSLQEQSDRNRRLRALLNTLTTIVQFFRRPRTALRAAHV